MPNESVRKLVQEATVTTTENRLFEWSGNGVHDRFCCEPDTPNSLVGPVMWDPIQEDVQRWTAEK